MENKDFKYVIQDITKLYIGAKLTYQEMMDLDDVSFKLKVILSHYMLKEVAGDTTPENHVFYMKDTDLSYIMYKQLKAKFKMNFPVLTKKGTWQYKSEYHTIEEIVHNEQWHEQKDRIVIEEMEIGKMRLAAIGI